MGEDSHALVSLDGRLFSDLDRQIAPEPHSITLFAERPTRTVSIKCNAVDLKSVNWQVLDSFQDRTVFQTREWVQFVGEAQRATPVLLEMTDNGKPVGYFTGLTMKRFGVRILGSSFPGWTTPYMGFNLIPGASRAAALEAVESLPGILSAACTWKSPILISRKKTADRLDLTWNITLPIARI